METTHAELTCQNAALTGENARLTAANVGLDTSNVGLRKGIEDANGKLAQLGAEAEVLGREKDDLVKEIDRLHICRDRLNGIRKRISARRQRLREAEEECRQAEQKNRRRAAELTAGEKQLGTDQEKLAKDQRKVVRDQQEVADERARLARKAASLEEERRQLAQAWSDYRRDKRRLADSRREHEEEAARLARTKPAKQAQRIDRLTVELADAGMTEKRLQGIIKKRDAKIEELRTRLLNRSSRTAGIPPAVLEWLQSGDGPEFTIPGKIVLLGDDPIQQPEFQQFLGHLDIEVEAAGDADIEVVVVGRTNCREGDLDAQIEARVDDTLKVYSQEMFVAALVTGRDPFGMEEDLLWAFGDGHPVLENLGAGPLDWPSTECGSLEDDPQFEFRQVEETPLHQMEYWTGKKGADAGKTPSVRRDILRKAFAADTDELPEVRPGTKYRMSRSQIDEYMALWGGPSSRKRLWRMAHHVAYLVRAFGHMSNQGAAVDDWSSDLAWMKKTLYSPRMRFRWPDTAV